MANFEVGSGNGRIYPLSKEDRAKERERMDTAAASNPAAKFLKDAEAPHYDGFIKIDQAFIDFLQAGFDQSEKKDANGAVRLNYKGYRILKKDSEGNVIKPAEVQQLNFESAWMAGLAWQKFKNGQATVTAAPDGFGEAPSDVFEDDEDIPF